MFYLICIYLGSLMCTPPTLYFQRVLQEKIHRGITTVSEKKTELSRSLKEITKDTIPVIKRILGNKSLNCLVFGDALIFLQIGSISYLPKIYAIAFRYFKMILFKFINLFHVWCNPWIQEFTILDTNYLKTFLTLKK